MAARKKLGLALGAALLAGCGHRGPSSSDALASDAPDPKQLVVQATDLPDSYSLVAGESLPVPLTAVLRDPWSRGHESLILKERIAGYETSSGRHNTEGSSVRRASTARERAHRSSSDSQHVPLARHRSVGSAVSGRMHVYSDCSWAVQLGSGCSGATETSSAHVRPSGLIKPLAEMLCESPSFNRSECHERCGDGSARRRPFHRCIASISESRHKFVCRALRAAPGERDCDEQGERERDAAMHALI